MLPNDPVILLSYVNTKLRDSNINLSEFCKNHNIDKSIIVNKLKEIGYDYNIESNQFK